MHSSSRQKLLRVKIAEDIQGNSVLFRLENCIRSYQQNLPRSCSMSIDTKTLLAASVFTKGLKSRQNCGLFILYRSFLRGLSFFLPTPIVVPIKCSRKKAGEGESVVRKQTPMAASTEAEKSKIYSTASDRESSQLQNPQENPALRQFRRFRFSPIIDGRKMPATERKLLQTAGYEGILFSFRVTGLLRKVMR